MHINRISDGRIQVLHEVVIEAAVKNIFPLACPVLEYKWIPGWKCELIHCPSGRVERGTVFKEIMSGPVLTGQAFGKTTWTSIYYNPEEYRVHYELQNLVSFSLYKLEFDEIGPHRTRFRMDLTYESINRGGNVVTRNHGGEKIGFMPTMLASLLKYYCENGKKIPAMEMKKMALNYKCFTMKDKCLLVLNEFAMRFMRDDNRKRFFTGMPISVSCPPCPAETC